MPKLANELWPRIAEHWVGEPELDGSRFLPLLSAEMDSDTAVAPPLDRRAAPNSISYQ
jgi:hypothetical protein